MSEWQPIETAPKDGTHILAYDHASNIPFVCLWTGKNWNFWGTGDKLYPQGWMPLPKTP